MKLKVMLEAEIEVECGDTIKEVKRKIEEEADIILGDRQQIVFNGETLS